MTDGTSQYLAQHREAGLLDSSGVFQIDPEKLAEKYASVLEQDSHGVLFFFQSAETLGARGLKYSVGRDRFELSMHIEGLSEHRIPEGDILPCLRQIFPQGHPLYGLAHGANILVNAKRTRSLSLTLRGGRLKLVWVYRVSNQLVDMYSTHLSLLLLQRLYLTSSASSGGLRIEGHNYPKHLIAALFHGEAVCPEPIVIYDPKEPLLTTLKEERVRTSLLGRDCCWRILTETSAPPLFEAKSEKPNHCAYLFHQTSWSNQENRSFLVPVKHGVCLEPIKAKYSYGHGMVFFDADSLKTDFSGLQLVENDEFHEALYQAEMFWVEIVEQVRGLTGYYQPTIDRQQAAVRTVAAAVGIPALIAGGLVLGGVPLLVKSGLALKFMGGGSVLGFLHQGRYVLDPEKYTEVTRQAMLSWLDRLPQKDELQDMIRDRYGQ